jgi:hypothetical protein
MPATRDFMPFGRMRRTAEFSSDEVVVSSRIARRELRPAGGGEQIESPTELPLSNPWERYRLHPSHGNPKELAPMSLNGVCGAEEGH